MADPKRERALVQLYASMLRMRTVEEGLAQRYSEQEMRCPVHLCTGQEAISAGCTLALRRTDYVLSGHRSHGHYLGKGGDLRRMVAEIYGRATGCAGGKGGSMHLVDLDAGFLGSAPIVGSTIPIAVGAAFGAQMRGEDRVTMVFFGDGASEAGVLHESLNFASLKNLPVVFVCENNLYSVYSPLEVRQPVGRAIVDLARSHDIEAQQADGNDAELVYGLASEAIEAARRGDGPRFLEFSTYRWREHCGPSYDDQLGYRPAGELDAWRSHDPLHELRDRLLELRAVDEHSLAQLETKFQQEFESAVQFARTSPFPDVTRLNMDVYAEPIHESEARAA